MLFIVFRVCLIIRSYFCLKVISLLSICVIYAKLRDLLMSCKYLRKIRKFPRNLFSRIALCGNFASLRHPGVDLRKIRKNTLAFFAQVVREYGPWRLKI